MRPEPTALRISPTEPTTIKDALTAMTKTRGARVRIDWTPENRGLDYMWIDTAGQWRGVQRKEVSDFLASLDDGRLSRELSQMTNMVHMPIVLIEGAVNFNGSARDSVMMTSGFGRAREVTREGWHKRLLSIMDRGVFVHSSTNMTDSAHVIGAYWWWSQSTQHSTGTTRPGPAGDWGQVTNRDWQAHLLQGLDGVGPKLAEQILDHLGYCPLQVVATRQQLLEVPGIGPKLATRILRVNGGSNG